MKPNLLYKDKSNNHYHTIMNNNQLSFQKVDENNFIDFYDIKNDFEFILDLDEYVCVMPEKKKFYSIENQYTFFNERIQSKMTLIRIECDIIGRLPIGYQTFMYHKYEDVLRLKITPNIICGLDLEMFLIRENHFTSILNNIQIALHKINEDNNYLMKATNFFK